MASVSSILNVCLKEFVYYSSSLHCLVTSQKFLCIDKSKHQICIRERGEVLSLLLRSKYYGALQFPCTLTSPNLKDRPDSPHFTYSLAPLTDERPFKMGEACQQYEVGTISHYSCFFLPRFSFFLPPPVAYSNHVTQCRDLRWFLTEYRENSALNIVHLHCIPDKFYSCLSRCFYSNSIPDK